MRGWWIRGRTRWRSTGEEHGAGGSPGTEAGTWSTPSHSTPSHWTWGGSGRPGPCPRPGPDARGLRRRRAQGSEEVLHGGGGMKHEEAPFAGDGDLFGQQDGAAPEGKLGT